MTQQHYIELESFFDRSSNSTVRMQQCLHCGAVDELEHVYKFDGEIVVTYPIAEHVIAFHLR